VVVEVGPETAASLFPRGIGPLRCPAGLCTPQAHVSRARGLRVRWRPYRGERVAQVREGGQGVLQGRRRYRERVSNDSAVLRGWSPPRGTVAFETRLAGVLFGEVVAGVRLLRLARSDDRGLIVTDARQEERTRIGRHDTPTRTVRGGRR
jgi:hypothetical protein